MVARGLPPRRRSVRWHAPCAFLQTLGELWRAGVLILRLNCARRAEPSDSLPELGAQSGMPWQFTDPALHGKRHCDEPSEFFEE